MATLMDGKGLSKKIESEIKKEVEKLKNKTGKVPTLATIIVGEDPASVTYVKMKQKACKRVGINSVSVELGVKTTTEELLNIINDLNNDPKINGILLQHPTPKQIDERKCFDAIDVKKDVDGVTALNFGSMTMGDKEAFLSATPLGIKTLIEHYEIEVEGKEVLVIGRSAILGKPVAMMMLNKNATVTIAHAYSKDLATLCKRADIVVSCTGKSKLIKEDFLKEGAVVIDAGYNEDNVGDVDIENSKHKLSAYTPVPGGVGPMTIASLLSQTLKSFKLTLK